MNKILNRLIYLFFLLSIISCDSGKPPVSDSTNELDSAETQVSIAPDSSDFDLLVQKIEDPSRREWQNPNLVIKEMGDLTNKTVVDIGAGTGYFTFRIAPAAAKVIATDIDSRFLNYIDERKLDFENDWVSRIETRQTVEDDPGIGNNEADVVLIVNTYHFLNNRVQYLTKVKNGMKAEGILLIVDFKEGDLAVSPPGDLIVTPEAAISEIRKAGFTNISVDLLSLEYQYIIRATR